MPRHALSPESRPLPGMLPLLILATIVHANPIPAAETSQSSHHLLSIAGANHALADSAVGALIRRDSSSGLSTVIIVIIVLTTLAGLATFAYGVYTTIWRAVTRAGVPTPANLVRCWRRHAWGKVLVWQGDQLVQITPYSGDATSIGPGMFVAGETGSEDHMWAVWWKINPPPDPRANDSSAGGGG